MLGQAIEIGISAISFLIETWEGHLTPPEAASIADRASRGCEPNLVRSAAELALSCLPYSHALNPNEITRAILQCKEQSDAMLEHACHTVESAAKGGGVYPEVLFQVAKYWYELYVRHTPPGELLVIENDVISQDPLTDPLVGLVDPNSGIDHQQQGPPGLPPPNQGPVMSNNGPVVVTTTPPPHFQHPSNITTLAPLGMTVPYAVSPYSFAVQGIHPHRQISYGGPIHPHAVQLHQPSPPHMQMYLPPPQFQYPPHANNQQFPTGQQPPYPNMTPPQQGGYPIQSNAPSQYQLPPPVQATYATNQASSYTNMSPNAATQMQSNIQYYGTAVTIAQPTNLRPGPVPSGHIFPIAIATNVPGNNGPQTISARPPPHRQQSHEFSQAQLRYLLAAYRVGMLALETLARRVHDDRPQAKYARNPPYGEDVKWLLRISKHLGKHS